MKETLIFTSRFHHYTRTYEFIREEKRQDYRYYVTFFSS